jgi:hypothetical protein
LLLKSWEDINKEVLQILEELKKAEGKISCSETHILE